MRRSAVIAVVVASVGAGCGHPGSPTPTLTPTPTRTPTALVDAGEASQEERLAAIEKAMNVLDEVAQQCWAKAATKRFDIEGRLVAQIDVAASAPSIISIVNDTTRNPELAACMTRVLAEWRWAPPLHGQVIQLPFEFHAPEGQSVIDRDLVDWSEQSKIAVAVLMDEANTGNAAASMFSIGMDDGQTTGMRRADRAELWYFQSWRSDDYTDLDITIASPRGTQHARAGDMMYVPKGGIREVRVKTPIGMRAVVVMVPGGREGAARAGALPTPEAGGEPTSPSPAPTILHQADVKQTGPAQIFVETATIKDATLAASILRLAAGANVPEHVHAHETEMLYMFAGTGTMTIAGVAQAVTRTSVIQVPPNTKHAFTATSDVAALQIYTPAGPEQRFKSAKP